MFKKILIANRGEIACRIIKTAKRMGISTVVVYSDADRNSLAVEDADESVYLGPSPAIESYLDANKILEAVKETGAEAVHPGYGFLSENSSFSSMLRKAGIIFIGPPPEVISVMGDKIESKKLANKAGVSTVPGYVGVVENYTIATEIAATIGYPVMIKASSGGGGKGMRIAYEESQIVDGFRLAQSEAKTSFGDDRIFIEKYIESPRHIEIQILADTHGNVIHLGERECSIQRRHQKVIEEAPSLALDTETREKMGSQACSLARAVGYQSAGTVEFILDGNNNFYFLEMNTRLQVEHAVTEMVTGLDLVELMIEISAGKPLPLCQKDVRTDGWAIEARVYAEDPERNFLPVTGRLSTYRSPKSKINEVRIDTGVREGSDISIYYDPMIAKLITHGDNRTKAINLMQDALDSYYIRGIGQNTTFLSSILSKSRFAEGRITTDFISDEYPDGYLPHKPEGDEKIKFLAAAAWINKKLNERDKQFINSKLITQNTDSDRIVVLLGADFNELDIMYNPENITIRLNKKDYCFSADWEIGQPLLVLNVNEESFIFQTDRMLSGFILTHSGIKTDVRILSLREANLYKYMPEKVLPDHSKYLLSPMPGLLVSIAVNVGDEVGVGEELAVVEAMKMENILYAETDGVVKHISVKTGDNLAVDHVIIEFE